MNATMQTSPAARLGQTREIIGELTRLIKHEPGYLPATLVKNTGSDPRFPVTEFPNFVWFLEARDGSKPAEQLLKKLPTRMDATELDAFRKGDAERGIMGFVPTSKGLTMLGHLAHSFMHRSMPILEGGTSLGKTYVIRAMNRLMHGNRSDPLHFYCDGQTDTTELLAKYVPNADDPGAKRVSEFMRSDEGKLWIDQQYSEKRFSAETSSERIVFDAANHLGVSINKNSFTLSFGALPKAGMAHVAKDGKVSFDAERPGRGTGLIVDELGAAKSAITLTFLRLRGEGEMVKSLQLWEDSGREVIFGPDTFVAFATNTLKYADRSPVDAALARSLNWCRMGELTETDIKELVELTTKYDYGQKKSVSSETHYLDLTQHAKLYELVGSAVVAAHLQVAPLVDKSQSGGDRQKIPCTFEDILKVLRYCQTSQVVGSDKKQGDFVDIAATVKEAVERQYFGRIASAADRETQFKSYISSMTSDKSALAVKTGGSGAESVFDAITREALVAWQREAQIVPALDQESLAQLEGGRELAEQFRAVDDVISKIRTITQYDLMVFVETVASTSPEEVKVDLRNKLAQQSVGPADMKNPKEWATKDGFRGYLVGRLGG